jgi:hypothetical protein
MQAGTTALLLIIFIYRNSFAYLPMIALHTLLSPYFAMSGIGLMPKDIRNLLCGYDSFMSSSKMIRESSLSFFSESQGMLLLTCSCCLIELCM